MHGFDIYSVPRVCTSVLLIPRGRDAESQQLYILAKNLVRLSVSAFVCHRPHICSSLTLIFMQYGAQNVCAQNVSAAVDTHVRSINVYIHVYTLCMVGG